MSPNVTFVGLVINEDTGVRMAVKIERVDGVPTITTSPPSEERTVKIEPTDYETMCGLFANPTEFTTWGLIDSPATSEEGTPS